MSRWAQSSQKALNHPPRRRPPVRETPTWVWTGSPARVNASANRASGALAGTPRALVMSQSGSTIPLPMVPSSTCPQKRQVHIYPSNACRSGPFNSRRTSAHHVTTSGSVRPTARARVKSKAPGPNAARTFDANAEVSLPPSSSPRSASIVCSSSIAVRIERRAPLSGSPARAEGAEAQLCRCCSTDASNSRSTPTSVWGGLGAGPMAGGNAQSSEAFPV